MKKRLYGFTITELVIVIAVVAVMAAVLVPIFSDIVGKANGLGDAVSAREANINAIIDGSETQTSTSASEGTTSAAAEEPQLTDILLMSSETLTTPNVTYKLITNEALEEVTLELAETSIYRLVIDAPNVQKIYIKYEEGASGEAQLGYVDILHTAQTSTHIHTTVLQLNVADGKAVVESDADVRAVDISPSENATATVELYSGTNEISANYKYHAGSSGDHITLIDHTGACNVTVCADDEAVENGTTTTITLKSTTSTPIAISVSADDESAGSFFESAQITVKVTVNEEEQTSVITAITPSVSAVTLDFETLELNVGGSSTLTAGLLPGGASGDIEWDTSDSSVATVSNGTVAAVGLGRATITATAQGVSAECIVHVGAASIGDTYYATFDEAKSAAVAEETIVLHQNISLSSSVKWTKSVTLDLNGKTITTTGGFEVAQKGALTVSDSSSDNSGAITSANKEVILVSKDSSFTLQGGTIRSTATYGIKNDSKGTFTINGGIVYGDQSGIWHSGSRSYINGGTIDGGDKGIDATSNLTITGGTISSRGTAIETTGSLDISGEAEIIGSPAIKVRKGKLTQSGGTITGAIKET